MRASTSDSRARALGSSFDSKPLNDYCLLLAVEILARTI